MNMPVFTFHLNYDALIKSNANSYPDINSPQGFRNDFQEALEKVDQTYLDELLASQAQTSNSRAVKEEEISPEKQITYDDIQNMAKDLGKGDRNLDMNVTLNLIQVGFFLNKMWGKNLVSYCFVFRTEKFGKNSRKKKLFYKVSMQV